MHNLDRVSMQREGSFEGEGFEFESAGEGEFGAQHGLNEGEVMELAAELLSVSQEQELEQFLGSLFSKAVGAVKGFANSSVGRALGAMLKPIAKAALPIAGGAIGSLVGGPAGGAIGSSLASKAGSLFGLELEGLSQEDREFEVAKQFVNLASTAASNAANAPQNAQPQQAARAALLDAAKQIAPGIAAKLQGMEANGNGAGRQQSMFGGQRQEPSAGARHGRWYRRGNKIVIVGV